MFAQRLPRARAGPSKRWEGISDTGGYAALIQTVALWLMYQEGTSDWESIKCSFPRNRNLRSRCPPRHCGRRQGL